MKKTFNIYIESMIERGEENTDYHIWEEMKSTYSDKLDCMNIHGNTRKQRMKRWNKNNPCPRRWIKEPFNKTIHYIIEIEGPFSKFPNYDFKNHLHMNISTGVDIGMMKLPRFKNNKMIEICTFKCQKIIVKK